VIVESQDRRALEEARALIAQERGGKVGEELPLIHGFAAEVDPGDARLAALLKGRGILFHDAAIGITEPVAEREIALDGAAHGMMDTGAHTVELEKMWNLGYRGAGVTICIIDTGIARHRDFGDRILEFHDFVGGIEGPEHAYDDNRHGTHCAGIAAGSGAESAGLYTGTAPEANLVVYKTMDKDGKGAISTTIKAIQDVIRRNEEGRTPRVDIISLSLSGRMQTSIKTDPLVQALEFAMKKGIIVLAAAGNNGPSPGSITTPGCSDRVMTLGSEHEMGTPEKSDDLTDYFSGRGPTKFDGFEKPDFVAPGVDIVAPKHTGGYVSLTGTSMATALAAGAVALLRQAHPEATHEQIKTAIMGTCDALPQGGDRNTQGVGSLNVYQAHLKL
jgi:serine protease AprX